ncbi:TetR/AcrR family transcriptional regulator [Ruania halotolerans]|uniref:TetR/AcrR family transcriptional regulator n=1 Tax=Ruania halotolerans TaxID=2897773 RepID=UPI001E5CEF22|nr:TetR/AcrR family transcriptional regulator [Ruania halotolerans]UFU07474.1 TetR/AcrR family transcriptional regulator [Ruania halotolerans]
MNTRASTRGRPRDEHIDAAVLHATARTLDDGGYREVAIEDVARRAGVSKSAVYRRWPNRRRLVLAVLADRLGRIEAPSTGCTMCDLHECLVLITRAICLLGAGTLAQLTAESAGEATLHEELLEVVIEPPRRAVHRTLFAARQRGDLREDVDLPLTVDVLASLTFYRQLFGRAPMTTVEIETVVSTMLRGIASDYDDLVREYAAHESHDRAQ